MSTENVTENMDLVEARSAYRAKRMLVGRATTHLMRDAGIKRTSKNVAQAIYDHSVTPEIHQIHKIAACHAQLHDRKTIKEHDMQVAMEMINDVTAFPEFKLTANGRVQFVEKAIV